MKVSIGVPIYNVSSYLEVCLRSLFEQTYDDIEFVFVNDCSTDNSMTIFEKVASQYPNRTQSIVLIQNKKNCGLATTRNIALEHATGEFIIWVDSDDHIDKQMVARFVEVQKQTNADIITCNSIVEYPNGTGVLNSPLYTTSKQMTLSLLRHEEGTPVSVWARFIRRSLYIENNIRALEGINNGEDFQVTPRLAYYAKKVSSIQDFLYYYNKKNPDAYTYKFSENQMNGRWKTIAFLESFFKDKGSEYLHALGVAKADALVNDMICVSLYGNETIFREVIKRRGEVDRSCLSELPFKYRIVFELKNHKLLRVLMRAKSKVKALRST